MSETVRIAIVDDDALVRAALRLMLDGAEGIVVVAEAADGAEVPQLLAAHPVDVVLMDVRMPRVDGIAATREVRERRDGPAVVVLTTFDTRAEVEGALAAGAAGYLLKDAPPERIVAAVRAAAAGEPVLAPQVARRLMDEAVSASVERAGARAALDRLTPREREVAELIGRGASNAEIGSSLHLSVPTVKAYASAVLEKLGLESRTQVALVVQRARG